MTLVVIFMTESSLVSGKEKLYRLLQIENNEMGGACSTYGGKTNT
jgi:hypothetical protein